MSTELPISVSTRRMAPVTATAGQTQFAFTFPVIRATDLRVLRTRAGTEAELAQGTDYTVSGAGTPEGGTVTLGAGSLADDVIVIEGDAGLDRLSSVAANGRFSSRQIDQDFDLALIRDQELRRDLDTLSDALDGGELTSANIADFQEASETVIGGALLPGAGMSVSFDPATGKTSLSSIGLPGGGSGNVVGPASAVNNRIAVFDGVTGRLLRNSTVSVAGNNMGIGTDTPQSPLDVVDVAPIFGGGRAANADKAWRPRVPAHSGTRFVAPFFVFNSAAANRVNIGGGTSTADAATELSFWTGPTLETPQGTERLRIINTGAFGLSGPNYGAAGNVMASAGASAPPTWQSMGAVIDNVAGPTPTQGDILYRGASAWERLPAGTSGQVLRTNGAGANPTWASSASSGSGTAVNSTSGTAIDFTGIPAGVRRVTIQLLGVSPSAATDIMVQLGAGSILTSGYTGGAVRVISSGNTPLSASSGFLIYLVSAATETIHGHVVLTNINGNSWVSSSVVGSVTTVTQGVQICGGSVALTNALDRIRITTFQGTPTFDAGQINISWEF